MRRLAEYLIWILLSALLVYEPVAFAAQSTGDEVLLRMSKKEVASFYNKLGSQLKEIIKNSEKFGFKMPSSEYIDQYIQKFFTFNDGLTVRSSDVEKLLMNIKVSYQNFKNIGQYPPIDVSQIDIASENLLGIFMNQVLGLFSSILNAAGGFGTMVGLAVALGGIVLSTPILIVFALVAGIIGGVLGLLVGLPLGLLGLIVGPIVSLVLNLGDDNGDGDNGDGDIESDKSSSSLFSDAVVLIPPQYDYFGLSKVTQQEDNGEGEDGEDGGDGESPIIPIGEGILGMLQGLLDSIMPYIQQLIGAIVPYIPVAVIGGLVGLLLPVIILGGGILFFGVLLGGIITLPLWILLFPVIFLFGGIGLAFVSIASSLFNMSLREPASYNVNKTLTEVVNNSFANLKGPFEKHIDKVAKDVISFGKELLGPDSEPYIDELNYIIDSSDLKSPQGIIDATQRILDFNNKLTRGYVY